MLLFTLDQFSHIIISLITSNKRFIIPLHYFHVIFTVYSMSNFKLGCYSAIRLLQCNTLSYSARIICKPSNKVYLLFVLIMPGKICSRPLRLAAEGSTDTKVIAKLVGEDHGETTLQIPKPEIGYCRHHHNLYLVCVTSTFYFSRLKHFRG